MKVCTKCKVEKELDNFPKHPRYKDGRGSRCKPCFREYYQLNRDRYFKNQKASNELNRDKILKRATDYRTSHKLEIKERGAIYRIKNKSVIAQKKKEYSLKNSDKIRAKKREYQKTICPIKRSVKHKDRMTNDSLYRYKKSIRDAIWKAINRNGYKKSSSTEKILGISLALFKKHIERHFKKGMTWENYGEWHIDHIIPLKTATSYEDVLLLNHYKNLTPLWAIDNLQKSFKIPEVQLSIAM